VPTGLLSVSIECQAALSIVSSPYYNAVQRRFAFWQAEAACELAPEQADYRATLDRVRVQLKQAERSTGHKRFHRQASVFTPNL
jgi:hypothetical protein